MATRVGLMAPRPIAPSPMKAIGPQVRAAGEALRLRAQQLEAGLGQLLLAERHLQLDDVRRVEEAPHVLLQAEDGQPPVGGGVGADALEDAQAVVQGVGHDGHLALGPGHQLAVEPDAVRGEYREEVELMAGSSFSRRRAPQSQSPRRFPALLQPDRPGQNGQLPEGLGAGGVAFQRPLEGAGGLLRPARAP